MIDAWLLRRFPGRTLEELDQMDWGRLNRALEAGRIERLEELRSIGTNDPSKVDPDDWAAIAELEELLNEDG